jgi:flagellar protein FlgJ
MFWYAKTVEQQTGLSVEIILTHAAVESAWGRKAPRFNYFGIKDTDGINGNEQLLNTIEYHDTPCWQYPETIRIVKTGNKYRYTVKDYFCAYNSPLDSFLHYSKIIENRYPSAWKHRCYPEKYFKNIKGYATSPTAQLLHLKVLKIIKKEIYAFQLLQRPSICEEQSWQF